MKYLVFAQGRQISRSQPTLLLYSFFLLTQIPILLCFSTITFAESSWQLSPIDIMGTGVAGFSESGEQANVRLNQNPTPSDASYRWYAQRVFTEEERKDGDAGALLSFIGDGFHTLEIWAGEGSLRSTRGFEKLLETRETLRQRFLLEPRREWAGRDIALKIILRKDHDVSIESSVLRIESFETRGSETIDSFIPDRIEPIERSEKLKIGAFNIQVFGSSKSRKEDVMQNLVEILTRYDIVLIQEIRDSSGTAIVSLLAQLNAVNQNDFGLTIGERLGSTEMKEQHAYLYRQSRVRLLNARSYPDRNRNFERAPYIAHFREHRSNQDLTLIGVHVDPDEAYDEIDSLHTVVTYAQRVMGDDDVVVMGDLNADCSYLREDELEELRLYYDNDYTWHISNDADTTTGLNTCAYDRIITRGPITDWTKSSSVYRFDLNLRLSREEVRRVSDHYPVEINLHLPIRASD